MRGRPQIVNFADKTKPKRRLAKSLLQNFNSLNIFNCILSIISTAINRHKSIATHYFAVGS